MVREAFDTVSLTMNEKELGPNIPKAEMKKAMPFIQSLKRRLVAGERGETVFDRKLAYDETAVLMQMKAGLKKTTGCIEVDIIAVDEGGKSGKLVGGEGEEWIDMAELPVSAMAAVPGHPSFHFENLS